GLESFGADGDPFDPSVHEAVQHSTSADVAGPTVSAVLRRRYRLGDRVLRPVMVAVNDRDPSAPDLPADLPGSDEPARGATGRPPAGGGGSRRVVRPAGRRAERPAPD